MPKESSRISVRDPNGWIAFTLSSENSPANSLKIPDALPRLAFSAPKHA
jgi:hypothetical protein